MKIARIVNAVAIILMLGTLSACQQVQQQKKADNLDRSLTSYEVALRWGMHKDAYSYHVDPDGSRPETDLNQLKEISVTGIDVLEKLVNEDQTEAYVRMIVNYYHKDRGTVRSLELKNEWWYSEDSKQWFIKTDFPEFK